MINTHTTFCKGLLVHDTKPCEEITINFSVIKNNQNRSNGKPQYYNSRKHCCFL